MFMFQDCNIGTCFIGFNTAPRGARAVHKLYQSALLLLLLLLFLPVSSWAKPNVKIRVEALKQIVVEEKGQKVIKRVPANEAKPGDTIIFHLYYHNDGDESAKDAMLVDPIPMETAYIEGSAFGAGSEITFSADEGKSYDEPENLFREKKLADGTVEKRLISARFYTHIRWVVEEIKPGKGGMCSFQVQLK